MPDEFPNPGEAGIPLVEGGNPAWNDVLQYVPEDKRAEVVPKLKEWDSSYQTVQQSYNEWKALSDQGIKAEDAQLAVNVLSMLEHDPKRVYDALGAHLGISAEEAQEVIEGGQGLEAQEQAAQELGIDPEVLNSLNQRVDALTRIALAEKQEKDVAKEEVELDRELKALEKAHGVFPEEEVIMRMMHKGLSAEEALNDYMAYEEQLLSRRPSAPRLLGSSGGRVPNQQIDVTKLDGKGTRDLVAQMLTASNAERE